MNREQREILDDLIDRYPDLSSLRADIAAAYEAIYACYLQGGKLLLCGNGGSCADGEHIVGELMKGFVKKRPIAPELAHALQSMGEDGAMLARTIQGGLPAIALNAPALSSAVINDLGGELAYAQQVCALGKPGDVFFGISTSGNARNLHLAALVAKAKGLFVIGLSGGSGGRMRETCDVLMVVPEVETYKVQERHLPIYHALCRMVEGAFFAE